jgi:hypothetical protein
MDSFSLFTIIFIVNRSLIIISSSSKTIIIMQLERRMTHHVPVHVLSTSSLSSQDRPETVGTHK